MKKTFMIAAVIVLYFLSTTVVAATASLQLTISSDKAIYTKGESINISGKLTNAGDEPVKINRNFVIHTDILPYFRKNGVTKDLSWLPPPFPAKTRPDSIIILKPGESTTFTLDGINNYLSSSQQGGLKPGNYTIKMNYAGKNEDFFTKKKFDCFTGVVHSNEVGFIVK